MSTKPSRRLTEERVAFLLGLQTDQNIDVIKRSLTAYTNAVVEPLIARVAELEKPWHVRLRERFRDNRPVDVVIVDGAP